MFKNIPQPLQKAGLLVGVFVAALIYFPLNHSVANSHVLAGSLDARLPLVPLLAIPYLILLPVFWPTVLYAWLTGKGFIKFAAVLLIVFGVSDLLFVAFPTYMPRPHHVAGVFAGLVRFIYRHDRPFNDLPSEHTAMATLLVFYFWSHGQYLKLAAVIFAVLVVIGTVLIKQHSLMGAISGVLLAVGAWLLANKLTSEPRQI